LNKLNTKNISSFRTNESDREKISRIQKHFDLKKKSDAIRFAIAELFKSLNEVK